MTSNSSINIEAFFKITYGLYIISSKYKEKQSGYISNTVFQVTAEPKQFAICCSKNNFTAELIKKRKAFSISVLNKEVESDIIGLFGYNSGKDVNKFENVNYITGKTGVPIVTDDTLAWFECEVVQTYDVGSHLLFIGKLISNALLNDKDEPLTYAYYREIKKGVVPKNAPTYIDKSNIVTHVKKATQTTKYKCQICGYIYEPEKGDPPSNISKNTSFDDLPEDWVCPVCGAHKSDFTINNQ